MEDINIDLKYNIDKISCVKDISDLIDGCVKKSVDEVMAKIGMSNVNANIRIGESIGKIISTYVTKSCEITATKVAIEFAQHIISKDIKQATEEELKEIFRELYYHKQNNKTTDK